MTTITNDNVRAVATKGTAVSIHKPRRKCISRECNDSADGMLCCRASTLRYTITRTRKAKNGSTRLTFQSVGGMSGFVIEFPRVAAATSVLTIS